MSPNMTETEPLLPPESSISSSSRTIDNVTFPPSMAAVLDKIEKELSELDNESDSNQPKSTGGRLGGDATLFDKKCLLVDRQIDAKSEAKRS